MLRSECCEECTGVGYDLNELSGIAQHTRQTTEYNITYHNTTQHNTTQWDTTEHLSTTHYATFKTEKMTNFFGKMIECTIKYDTCFCYNNHSFEELLHFTLILELYAFII